MPHKSELNPVIPGYMPHFNNLQELVENKSKLDNRALLLEIARFKYVLGQETIELMEATKNLDPRIKKELIRLISLVALSDVPDVESMIEEEDKAAILEALEIVNLFKANFKTKH